MRRGYSLARPISSRSLLGLQRPRPSYCTATVLIIYAQDASMFQGHEDSCRRSYYHWLQYPDQQIRSASEIYNACPALYNDEYPLFVPELCRSSDGAQDTRNHCVLSPHKLKSHTIWFHKIRVRINVDISAYKSCCRRRGRRRLQGYGAAQAKSLPLLKSPLSLRRHCRHDFQPDQGPPYRSVSTAASPSCRKRSHPPVQAVNHHSYERRWDRKHP